jgi:hypothetical protein
MKATLLDTLTIRQLIDRYCDNGDNGVVALGGKLNVRPAFQREFVYSPKDRDMVMKSVYNNLPLNVMYWAKNPDGTFEIIDGQQRTISICQFITNDDGYGNPIAINFDGRRTQTFANLSPEKQQEILDDYKLQVYVCDGTEDEKLEWFHTINIAGKVMEEQELLNADYTGTWLTSAKAFFSKKNNNQALNYRYYDNNQKHNLIALNSEAANRQALLHLVLGWIIETDKDQYPEIKHYMSKHRNDQNADELINYYKSVIDWVHDMFGEIYYNEMRGLPWGLIYNKYRDNIYGHSEIQQTVARLMADDEVQNKKGIFDYVFDNNKKHLNLRQFDSNIKRTVYQKQCGICPYCANTENESKMWGFDEMEGDHIVPWAKGGKTVPENCQMLCKHHNRIKSDD